MTAYRRLVRLYPRSFRDAYGDDLVALFEDQRADEPASRVWRRALADLLVSVPVQHLEVHMSRRSPRTVSAGVVVIGVVLLSAGTVVGTAVSPLLLLAGVGLVVAGVVVLQQHRDVVAPTFAESWWKPAVAGVALLVTIGLARTFWPAGADLDGSIAWSLTFFGIVASIVLLATGAVLGGLALVSRRPASR